MKPVLLDDLEIPRGGKKQAPRADYFNYKGRSLHGDNARKYGSGKKTRMDYAKYDGRTIKIGIRGKL